MYEPGTEQYIIRFGGRKQVDGMAERFILAKMTMETMSDSAIKTERNYCGQVPFLHQLSWQIFLSFRQCYENDNRKRTG